MNVHCAQPFQLSSTVKYHFITKLEREDKQGYMVLYRLPETENNMITNKLCDILKPKKVVERKLITGEQRVTKPVGRFTESSLIKELEKRGIGRPSTYQEIITNIQDRGYVKSVSKRLFATKIANLISDRLNKGFSQIMDFC